METEKLLSTVGGLHSRLGLEYIITGTQYGFQKMLNNVHVRSLLCGYGFEENMRIIHFVCQYIFFVCVIACLWVLVVSRVWVTRLSRCCVFRMYVLS